AVTVGFDITQDSRILKPAWMGLRVSEDLRDLIQEGLSDSSSEATRKILEGITCIPYKPHKATAVCDAQGRLFFLRSNLTTNMLNTMLPAINALVPEFVKAILKPFTEGDMLQNSRGEHWFSIAGHDRNNKKVNLFTLAVAFANLFNFLLDPCCKSVPARQ
ncbi:hypothetical protein BT96DRAFT_828577, partial [Gymnopus androsaceus JB14]